ncbi:hypothetical protein XA68_17200 [Ophiocordyceps unilateralis]|uniref:XPG-I domain-containing protein n=1 Tax=Ophiocordyceps unilateralis TaxID=268505 RepID=A0A2A9P3K9_OPHUN|nr:hypothetical protein XA68_17200 [Ophiocordyceps unilateralis]
MGIKGLFNELPPGRRVALSKLAADSFVSSNRPIRIAIDVSIWNFQVQASRGGRNPEIRTLFFRLVRLLGTPIQPVFVFDGPHKPRFKRHKRSGLGNGVSTAQIKVMMELFGFATHNAPGEAEAECALLQKNGIVDAVLSEDVDTLLFGCTRMLRNGSAKEPNHMVLHEMHGAEEDMPKLDAQGMILVALMSGGDYIPEGIPGCGVKLACEAAKAGFGRSLCLLDASDKEGMQAWREGLIHELHVNEKGHFRRKHPALTVPDDFPNLEVLRYYTHPIVSQQSSLDSVRRVLMQVGSPRLAELREFARQTFKWEYRIEAIKFIRLLAPAMLVHNVCYAQGHELVKRITARRQHFSTDGSPELRLTYVPLETVPIDLSIEVDAPAQGRDGQVLNGDDEIDVDATAEPPQVAALKAFDVNKPELTWVLEEVARRHVPGAVQAWEKAEAAKAAKAAEAEAAKAARAASKAKSKAGVRSGPLDGFVCVTKTARLPVPNPLAVAYTHKLLLPARRSETILLTSDAVEPPVSPSPTRADKLAAGADPRVESLSPTRHAPASGRSSQELKGKAANGKGRRVVRPARVAASSGSSMTQTSMNRFLCAGVVCPATQRSEESDLEPISTVVRRSTHETSPDKRLKTTTTIGKKTLLTAHSGFIYEMKMSAGEREKRLQTSHTEGRVAMRLSDASVIDLTGD